LLKPPQESFSKDEITKALAVSARKNLPSDKLEQALMDAGAGKGISKKQIDAILSDTAQTALNSIAQRDNHSILGHKAKEIIDLGMVIYGNENKVVDLFGPKNS
jgi:cobalamin biosynthesis protein CbiG